MGIENFGPMSANGSELEGGWQPTQLLQAIMDTKVSFRAKSGAPSIDVDDSKHDSEDVSSDSPSRSCNSLPVYHFHGLAATQTQTHQNEEIPTFETDESSQKGNISATSTVNGDHTSNDPGGVKMFKAPPEGPAIRVPHADQASPTPSLVTKPKSTPSNSLSFKPPFETTEATSSRPLATRSTTYPIIHTTRTPRAELEQYSQDSFAGPLSQDPERQFLAAAKQFEVPLSELERIVSSPEHKTRLVGQARSVGSMYSYSHNKRRLSPHPEGRILVAATPSNSDGSQSQTSQPFYGFGGQGQQVAIGDKANGGEDIASQRSTQEYESSYPSSSYERLLNGERDPDTDAQATQPCTQEDADKLGGDYEGTQPGSIAPNTITGTSATTSTNTHPRSLLNMVRTENKWRYKQFEDHLPPPSPQNPATSRQRFHAAVDLQETQPTSEDESTRPLRRQFPKPVHSTTSLSTSGGAPTRLVENNDQMDIVPDSEPSRDDSRTSRPGSAAPSPTKKLIRLNSDSLDAIPSSGEIVSDSMVVDTHEGGAAYNHHGKRHIDVLQQSHSEEGQIMDDDDDDIPLAEISSKKMTSRQPDESRTKDPGPLPTNKGKAPAGVGRLKQNKPASKPSSGTAITGRGKNTGISDPAQKDVGHSSEMKTIPSSIPGENMETALPSARRLRANSKTKEKATKSTIPPRGGAQKRSRLKAGRARDGHSHEPLSESEDELAMREAGLDEEEDGTEPADDDYAEVDHTVAGPSTRKRKRGAPATTRTTRARSKATKKVVKQPSVTPIIRQGKRLRTASINRGAYTVPTRVFALWKDDGHYYPGVVQSHEGGSMYLVKFDDKSTAKVKIDQMRLCELHVGDDVLLPPHSHGCKVVDVTKFDSENVVGVSVEDAVEELLVSDILIANKTIMYAWKDRVLTSDSIVPVQAKPSPTPSKLSLASAPSVRNNHRKILAKTGVVITLSSNNNSQWEKDRENIMAAVRNTGVTVIEDWASIFRMEGKHSHSNNRWVIEKSEVKWIENKDVERVFLLADNANQKPKFLLALGLGIPCVSVSWLHDSVNAGEDKEWQAYLLPQGYSDTLHARPSQQIDMDWGNSVHQLINIMDSSVACKVFNEKSILCVGQDMVPQPKGKKLAGTDEKAQEAYNAVARIILSMGARRVEAISELRYSSAPVTEFDFVVIKEAHRYDPAFDNGYTVHWPWVKDCLIASRQLPLPVWGPGLASSQNV